MDNVQALLDAMPTAERQAIIEKTMEFVRNSVFIPSAGPQYDAYHSKADVLLYGGSAGSGKTSLILGLAFTQHKNSLIMRRHYTELASITEEAIKLNGTRDGYNGSPPPSIRTKDGRLIQFGACQNAGDEAKFIGNPKDLLGFDEVVYFLESQVRFLQGWVRSTDVLQRCRTVMATNPPIASEGDWIIGYFRPWLDVTHPNPAQHGELRWYVTDPDGKDMEVAGPEPVQFGDKTALPESRSFIPGKLSDNPYLARTDYAKKLDSMPEPMRSAYRDGNFMMAREDDQYQVIPTDWVNEAVKRWTAQKPQGVPQCAIGVDVAQGGKDETVLAIRHDGWYDKLITEPGANTPFGRDVAALVMRYRIGDPIVVIDMGGGYGGAAYEHLHINNAIQCVAYKGGERSAARIKGGRMGFANRRSQDWWRFREALDPSQPGGSRIALPSDPQLIADLCSPRFRTDKAEQGIIALEEKDEIRKRLGRSPDKGDAVVMAWSSGATIADSFHQWKKQSRPSVIMNKRR